MNGDIEHYFTHEMKKAKVVGVSVWKPNTCDEASKKFRDMEQVRFMFEGKRLMCSRLDRGQEALELFIGGGGH